MTVSNMRNYLYLLSLGLLLLLNGCASSGSSSAHNAPTIGSTGNSTASQANDDLIRVGDSLAVRLSGVPMNDQGIYEVRVDEGGFISMPYIGNVQAAGLTSVALKTRIEAAYRENGIFPTSNIQIFTREVRYVNVNGEVRAPQRVAYTKDLTVTGAIAACGGYTEYANKRRVKILRNGQLMETNTVAIMKDPSLDVRLLPNDIVQVDRSIF